MFRKLLKYDVKIPKIILLVTTVSLFMLFTVADLITRIPSDSWLIAVFCSLYEGFTVLAAMASLIVPPIVSLIFFRRSMCSDEAYFTFTLPIPRKVIFREKAVLTMLWNALTDLVFMIAALWGLLLSGLLSGNVKTEFAGLFGFITNNPGFAAAILFIVPIVQYLIFTTGAFFFVKKTTGNVKPSKNKTTDTVIFIVVLILILDFLPSLLIMPVVLFVLFGVDSLPLIMTNAQILSYFCIFVWQIHIAVLMLSVFLHVKALDKLENKLNLP